ncbi:hypothetical protein Tsp_10100 [Trichinella spiralis]|uniref:hypothetical protein n=1 Tax=Trichinella spiralis TaxID=6334 RepID=UPI0001EFD11F|nr:hypothetical protein Tsp_10100 [Trichinella spiralis]
MKTVFIIATAAFFFCYEIQGKLQKIIEPLPCEDRGGDVTCKKLQKSLTFLDECLSNRRTGRYLCCRTCAKGLGVEITEEGKFKGATKEILPFTSLNVQYCEIVRAKNFVRSTKTDRLHITVINQKLKQLAPKHAIFVVEEVI